MTGVVPTLCLIIQLPSAMCGMSLMSRLRTSREPVMNLLSVCVCTGEGGGMGHIYGGEAAVAGGRRVPNVPSNVPSNVSSVKCGRGGGQVRLGLRGTEGWGAPRNNGCRQERGSAGGAVHRARRTNQPLPPHHHHPHHHHRDGPAPPTTTTAGTPHDRHHGPRPPPPTPTPTTHLCSTKSKGSHSWSSPPMGSRGGVPIVDGWRGLEKVATMPSSGVPGMTRWMMREKGAPPSLAACRGGT